MLDREKEASPVSLLSDYIFSLEHREVAAVIRRVIRENLSYNNMNTLFDLAQVAIENEKRHLKGVIIEAGCGAGGSAITLAAAKTRDRKLLVYDVFDLHPPPTAENGTKAIWRYKLIADGKSPGIGGRLYYGYEKDLRDKVLQSLTDFGFEAKKNNIYLKKGLFEDTLKIESPASLAHLDCDCYDSVLTCLNRIVPHLVRGGTMVVHDYWPGGRKAVEEYFGTMDRNEFRFVQKTALYIVKK